MYTLRPSISSFTYNHAHAHVHVVACICTCVGSGTYACESKIFHTQTQTEAGLLIALLKRAKDSYCTTTKLLTKPSVSATQARVSFRSQRKAAPDWVWLALRRRYQREECVQLQWYLKIQIQTSGSMNTGGDICHTLSRVGTWPTASHKSCSHSGMDSSFPPISIPTSRMELCNMHTLYQSHIAT